MAETAGIRPAQIERARRLLQDLPPRDDRRTRDEAAALLEKDFRKAWRKGYGAREICAILRSAGIVMPVRLVQQFCADPAKKPAPPRSEPRTEVPKVTGGIKEETAEAAAKNPPAEVPAVPEKDGGLDTEIDSPDDWKLEDEAPASYPGTSFIIPDTPDEEL